MGLNLTNYAALLKEEFTTQRIANMTYKRNKLLGLLPKSQKFGGSDVKVPLIYGNPQAVGPFSNAQTNKTSTQTSSSAFTLVRRKKYSLVTLDAETIKASKGDDAAFLEGQVTEIEGAFGSLNRDLTLDMYRDGTGILGVIDSTATLASHVVILTNKADARNFEVGMFVNCVHSNAVIGSTTKAQITGVDTGAGTLTIGSNWSVAFSGLATGDSICRDGCFNANPGATTASLTQVDGLMSWVPSSAPGATSFYGVDRSVNPTRMGGVRYSSATGEPIEEILIGLSYAIGAEGGMPDVALMNFENGAALQKALGAKKTYTVTPTKRPAKMPDGSVADIAYSGIAVNGPEGDIDVIFDNACPPDRMFMLQTDTWLWRTLGDGPGILDLDDNQMLREATSDGYEIRIGFYGNLQCNAPGWNGVALIS